MLSSAGKPDWILRIQHRPIKDHPGSDHTQRFLSVFGFLFERTVEMELRGWVCNDHRSGICNLQKMVIGPVRYGLSGAKSHDFSAISAG